MIGAEAALAAIAVQIWAGWHIETEHRWFAGKQINIGIGYLTRRFAEHRLQVSIQLLAIDFRTCVLQAVVLMTGQPFVYNDLHRLFDTSKHDIGFSVVVAPPVLFEDKPSLVGFASDK